MRWIYLSPHLDDAVLSCGGIILEQRAAGIPVEIWNWMCGTPPDGLPLSDLARSVHAGWELDSVKEVYAVRLAEDRQAAAKVGAKTRGFNFLDCIYRQADDGSFLYPEEIFVPVREEDAALVDEISALIAENMADDDVLVCPLGIGNHPDHALVRRAAEQMGYPLHYYADIPYTIWHPEQYAALTKNLQSEVFSIAEEALAAWQDAIMGYASQIASLFLTEENMRNSIREYWGLEKGIKLFTRK